MISKKAALELSINAIVILVIGIVVLGLSLTLIRGWFAKAGTEVGGLLDVSGIKDHADASTPLRIPSEVNVKTGDSTIVTIAFYNKDIATKTQVNVGPAECKSATTGEIAAVQPKIVSSQIAKVDPAKEQGFKTVLNTKSGTQQMTFGQYLCKISIESAEGIAESTTFILNVGQ